MHPERARANWIGFYTIVRKEMQRILRRRCSASCAFGCKP